MSHVQEMQDRRPVVFKAGDAVIGHGIPGKVLSVHHGDLCEVEFTKPDGTTQIVNPVRPNELSTA